MSGFNNPYTDQNGGSGYDYGFDQQVPTRGGAFEGYDQGGYGFDQQPPPQQQQGGYEQAYGSQTYGQEEEYNYGEFDQQQQPQEAAEGIWAENTSFQFEAASNAVTALEYDEVYERIWSGHQSGRIISSTFSKEMIEYSETIQANRYSSFMVSKDPVLCLHPVQNFVLSTTADFIHMHTDGGIPLSKLSALEMIESGTTEKANFTCSSLVYQNLGLLVPGAENSPTHLLAGTNKGIALAYDLAVFGDPLLTYNTGCATMVARNNSRYSALGGSDGKVRLLDSRMRSAHVQHTLSAHQGPLLDMSLHPNDTTLLTCGKVERKLNPYDPNSPVKHGYDPLVKVFDLRTNRQLPPLSMGNGTPLFMKFVPAPPSMGGYGSQVALFSGTGAVQVCDPNGASSGAEAAVGQIIYAPLASQRDSITSAGKIG